MSDAERQYERGIEGEGLVCQQPFIPISYCMLAVVLVAPHGPPRFVGPSRTKHALSSNCHYFVGPARIRVGHGILTRIQKPVLNVLHVQHHCLQSHGSYRALMYEQHGGNH